MADFPDRKTIRLKGFDYNTAGAYFITICTKGRKCILSDVICNANVISECQTPVGTGVPDGPYKRNDICKNDTGRSGVSDRMYIRLKPCGRIAEKYLLQLNDYYDELAVDKYVIMPNHIHFVLVVLRGKCERAEENVTGPSRTPVPTVNQFQNSTVSRFISTFKRFCNREIGENIWQNRSYDHVIRDKDDYDTRAKYICENPMRWKYDEMFIID